MQGVRVISMSLVSLVLAACTAASSSTERQAEGDAGASASIDGARASSDVAAPLDPTITKLAYIEGPTGPRILVAGDDPDERMESVWIDLLDDDGKRASIDPEQDGSAEENQLEIATSAMERGRHGDFFFEIQGSVGLDRFVRRVAAAPQDRLGVVGVRRTAALAKNVVRGLDEPCDLQGFDACEAGLVCIDAANGSRCSDLDSARELRCANAPTVVVGATIEGAVTGASLWDPEEGCASVDRRNRPEGVVRLHVSSPVRSLVVATLASGTNVDSVVSVLDGCKRSSKTLACNDDDPPPTSRVVLTDVAAGDYIVIVDSLDRVGGTFELAVTAP